MKSHYPATTDLPPLNVPVGSSFVRVENANGRLRLRFSYSGKRYVLAVGLPDSKVNRLVALQKAAQIECSSVWIGESVSRGNRKTTKIGKDRTVTLTGKIAEMLKERRPDDYNPESLVFPVPSGLTINDHTFRRRAWKTILSTLGIDYRKPYATRHTAISHALAHGANPLAVAEATGHDPQILFKHYASVIQRSAVMVEF